MSAVTQLHRSAAHPLAQVSGAPRPPLMTPPGPAAPAGATVLPFRPAGDPDPSVPDGGGAAADAETETVQRIAGIACSVVQGALEVLDGVRPLQQLARWLDPENYERLQLRANLVRCIRSARGAGARSPHGSSLRQVVVRSARVCPVSTGVYEVSVVAVDRRRVRAVALRIEQRRGVWRVTALEIG